MIPKEKAQELINKFAIYSEGGLDNAIQTIKGNAKECALIAVDEIMQHCYQVMKPFWEEVKQEIEKL